VSFCWDGLIHCIFRHMFGNCSFGRTHTYGLFWVQYISKCDSINVIEVHNIHYRTTYEWTAEPLDACYTNAPNMGICGGLFQPEWILSYFSGFRNLCFSKDPVLILGRRLFLREARKPGVCQWKKRSIRLENHITCQEFDRVMLCYVGKPWNKEFPENG